MYNKEMYCFSLVDIKVFVFEIIVKVILMKNIKCLLCCLIVNDVYLSEVLCVVFVGG